MFGKLLIPFSQQIPQGYRMPVILAYKSHQIQLVTIIPSKQFFR